MNRTSRIITFIIAAGLSYGSLFAFVGPEKVKAWHKQRIHHHGYHHDHQSSHHDSEDHEETENL